MKMEKLKLLVISACFLCFLTGCKSTDVIAATGTTIGLEIGMSDSNKPIGVLGYKRAELAIVPTNKMVSSTGETSFYKDGAKDVADVLMELRYGPKTSDANGVAAVGIYQRLAVGKNAVSQPGAILLAAKDSKGDINTQAVQAVMAGGAPQQGLAVSGNTSAMLASVHDGLTQVNNNPEADSSVVKLDALDKLVPNSVGVRMDTYTQSTVGAILRVSKNQATLAATGFNRFNSYLQKLQGSAAALRAAIIDKKATFHTDFATAGAFVVADAARISELVVEKEKIDAELDRITDALAANEGVKKAIDTFVGIVLGG